MELRLGGGPQFRPSIVWRNIQRRMCSQAFHVATHVNYLEAAHMTPDALTELRNSASFQGIAQELFSSGV